MNELDIPIDIHTNKLLDWLISRRHCPKEWQQQILNIREKINNAIQDMPVHEGIVQLLSGTYINYFHCLKIIEILKETEADSKNLFGRYGSQRMRDWQEIVRLYEKDNIYIAEAAQMLARNVNFEIPSIRKQIHKLEQTQLDCEKREKDCAKAERLLRNEFFTSCKQLGIAGSSIKKELVELLATYPELCRAAADCAKAAVPAVEYYKDFIQFSTGKIFDNLFPILEYVIEHGNTTTYQWTYGEAPVKIEEPALNINFDQDSTRHNEDNTIDFGDTDEGAGGDIDWGGITDDNVQVDVVDEIDFNISLEESGIVVEDDGIEGGVARGNDAYTILDNPSTRNRFINELVELEAFLKMRLYEMSNESSMDMLSQLQATGSALLQLQTPESISNLLSGVQGVIASISNATIQHLFSVKHSPRYVDYLTRELEQKLTAAEKSAQMQRAIATKRNEAFNQAISFQPILDRLIDKTRELQLEIEKDISKRYKGRPVNLMSGL